jgi:hypothetical protein
MTSDVDPSDNGYFDPLLGMTITRSGRAYWRERMREARERLDPQKRSALRRQFGLPENPGPTKDVTVAGVTYRLCRPQ